MDDCSTDNTGDVARALGVTVVRPPTNTGSKAGAQSYVLDGITTEFTMAIDADTELAPDAIERLLAAFDDPDVVAACGFVLPRYVETAWERGRYVEYLFAFSFYKQIQDFYRTPLISSGCFSAYRTDALKACGGWQQRTLAEDMDLTWSFYAAGHKVRFLPDALCYPIEPHTYTFMRKQLRRWSHGFIQNVQLHWRDVLRIPFLRLTVAIALWDATIASLAYLLLVPLLSLLFSPFFLLVYIVDLPAILVPISLLAIKRHELVRMLRSLPAFIMLRLVNSMFMLEALWSELLMRRRFSVYEKGH